MKKFVLVSVLVISFILLLVPVPVSFSQNGAYNTLSRIIWCKNESACIHEIAHKMDHENGWVSQTTEFHQAVRVYLLWQSEKDGKPDELYNRIIFTENLSYKEIYAVIFEYANGKQENIPDLFKPFYDWERAEELLKRYERLK